MAATKKPIYLSASRIDTFQTCSQLFWAKYGLKLPDTGNDGSRRGSTVHDTLELLLKPRHRKVYEAAVLHNTCTEVPALWKLVTRFARKYGVNDSANLKIIDEFIMVALKHEFFGPKGTISSIAEKDFEFHVDRGDGRKYSIKGFIDQVFTVQDKHGLILVVRDFKTSKERFEGDKLEFNVQSLIYQLALRELFPDIKRREFHFLFLKFAKKARQDQPSFTDDQLDGFEWMLAELQTAMETFTEENAQDHFAADDPDKEWLCGREGYKKDGTPAWMCSVRKPFDYWALLDEHGQIVTSAFTEAELTADPAKKQRIEKRRYAGCPRFAKTFKGGLS